MSLFFLSVLMRCITLMYFSDMLHLYILRINPAWSFCIVFIFIFAEAFKKQTFLCSFRGTAKWAEGPEVFHVTPVHPLLPPQPPWIPTSCSRGAHSVRFLISVFKYSFLFYLLYSLIGIPFRWLSLLLFQFFQCFKFSHFSTTFLIFLPLGRVSHPIFYSLIRSSDESFLLSSLMAEFFISTINLFILGLLFMGEWSCFSLL